MSDVPAREYRALMASAKAATPTGASWSMVVVGSRPSRTPWPAAAAATGAGMVEGGDSDDGEVDDEGELRIWTVTDERGHNHASGVYRALH